jgi:hypothetical protein
VRRKKPTRVARSVYASHVRRIWKKLCQQVPKSKSNSGRAQQVHGYVSQRALYIARCLSQNQAVLPGGLLRRNGLTYDFWNSRPERLFGRVEGRSHGG